MDITQVRKKFGPAVRDIILSCRVTEDFVDKDMFRVYLATIWGNAVLDPAHSGIDESDLPQLHDYLNEEIARMLGEGQDLTRCYEYLVSQEGEDSLTRLQVTARHKEFLFYFARLILSTAV
jgi:hypothetical protein